MRGLTLLQLLWGHPLQPGAAPCTRVVARATGGVGYAGGCAPLSANVSPLQLVLGSLFQGLELGSLQPTSLTLMYPLGTASANNTVIHLEPMEIATFRLRFG